MRTIKLFTLFIATLIMGSANAQICDATFTSTNPSPGTYVFTNAGTYGGYYWDFGDGTTGNGQTVTNVYTANGGYEVCLTVYDSITQCSATSCDSVFVTGLSSSITCDASFTSYPDSTGSVYFQSAQSGSGYSYYWDFGDGNSSSVANPMHTYTSNGTYTACLTVWNGSNCSDTVCNSITITTVGSNPGNTCDASFDAIADSVTCNSIYYGAYSSNYTNYYWDFGDGSTASNVWGVHTYSQDGTYTVALAVMDFDSSGNYICGDTTYQTIVINCSGGSGTTCNADFILFQDSTNSGVYYAWNMSTGNNLTYFWDFGDGNTSTQAYPIHTYANVGSYNLCLTIDDGNGCTSTYCDTITIVVKGNGTVLNVLQPGQAVSVGDVNVVEEVNLYPNPNNGQFNLSLALTQNGEFTISIMNYVGQVIESNTVGLNAGQNVLNMNIENHPKGVYIVNIMDQQTGSSRNIKLIKE